MYKRALMLTAATVALLSGPAFADTTITNKTTDKLKTSTAGSIDVQSTGLIVIPSSSNASTAPAIEIDGWPSGVTSGTVNIETSGALQFQGTASAVGIQADTQGLTGEIKVGGTIDLTGANASKTGILFTDPSATPGTFTGLVDAANTGIDNVIGGRVTALDIATGASIQVVGDSSFGVHLTTGNTIIGDIYNAGAISVTATNATAQSASAGLVTGIELDGTLNGNFLNAAGGSITAIGTGSTGVIVTGHITGSFVNQGAIAVAGTSAPSTTVLNPSSGSGVAIEANVDGGIYNGGPGVADTSTATATITAASSDQPAFSITPFSGTTATPVVIGGMKDPLGVFGDSSGLVSFLNRGTISSAMPSPDQNSIAVSIMGLASATGTITPNTVTLTDGLVNAGAISATSTTDTKSAATQVSAVGLQITNAILNNGIINSNLAGGPAPGSITATVSGAGAGQATAISIGFGSVVSSITNSGTIAANATTTDTTITGGLSATAIGDTSGSLSTINNTGLISASTTALDNLALNNNIAVNVAGNATGGVTFTNTSSATATASVNGDILFGSGGDTLSIVGFTTRNATVTGNVDFGGTSKTTQGNDQLIVGDSAVFDGAIVERSGGALDINIAGGGFLTLRNGSVTSGPNASNYNIGLSVHNLGVALGGQLQLTLSQQFNQQSNPAAQAIVTSTGSIHLGPATGDSQDPSTLGLVFGSFVSSPTSSSTFTLLSAPILTIDNFPQLETSICNTSVPFLFQQSTGGCLTYNNTPAAGANQTLTLSLTPKCPVAIAGDPVCTPVNSLDLKGYALQMFKFANTAMTVDPNLGAAVVSAGIGITEQANGNALYQKIYSQFAPDVTGASRAEAISITDQSSGPVAARQRALRMYAGQDGEATLWGQEFGQRLDVSNKVAASGYADTGFGFAMGMDEGNPSSGRYGAALSFYSGGMNEKQPRASKTDSEWYMLTGYTDWRNHSLFFDSQLSAAYGHLDGKRTLNIDDGSGTTFSRTAEGKRAAALLAGGITTGYIMNSGGTVLTPQISLDGLTMREEGYTETNHGITTTDEDGFDLAVKPYYSNSLRAFAGVDLRQDLRFADFYLQPEVRAGYRYDFIDGAEKLKGQFICSTVATGCGATEFSIIGPDPARANLVLGGGFAVTTGAWSIGLNYDYKRGVGGTEGVDQSAILSLIGRI